MWPFLLVGFHFFAFYAAPAGMRFGISVAGIPVLEIVSNFRTLMPLINTGRI